MNTKKYITLDQALEVLDRQSCYWAAEYMKLIPAADVRPVVKGRWEYNPGDNIPYCSECMMPQDSECNFCPNCGANMTE